MRSTIVLNKGSLPEPQTRVPAGTSPAIPRADTLQANVGESLASLTQRAYGANTSGLRARILRANATLDGDIIAPR